MAAKKTKLGSRRFRSREEVNGHPVALLARAVDNFSELIGMTDVGGRILFANRSLFQKLGYAKHEVIGKHFAGLFSLRNPRSLVEEIGTKGLRPQGWRGECLLRRADGSDLSVLVSVGPFTDAAGRVTGMFCISQDITDRKETVEKLRRSEEQFRQLAENIREVFFISPGYEEIWARPRQRLYEEPNAWLEAVHPEDHDKARESLMHTLRGVATDTQFRVVRPDSSTRWVHARTFPVFGSDHRCIRVVGIAEDITGHKEAETALRAAHDKLNAALRESQQRARETGRLTELVDVLQTCQSVEEAYEITQGVLETTFAPMAGALFILNPSRNTVAAVASWGDVTTTEQAFGPEGCWALRRGKLHVVSDATLLLQCGHVRNVSPGGYLCVPMTAQSETLGMLYLSHPGASADPHRAVPDLEEAARRAMALSERISLALSNLRLRDVLRAQSVRDPLTGLFNRRFMEESLDRELGRATRGKKPVALMMLDIDNFKQFNDTFDHQAGDTLLRSLGEFIRRRTRGQDVACRFGGEEFAFILANATVEDAGRRAEILRDELKELHVQHGGQLLGAITLSIGIAVFPEHGTTVEELVHSADQALYRAKTMGRDCTMVGEPVGAS